MPNIQQIAKIRAGKGFIAALDQSGGSTPKALALYGISNESWTSDTEMYDLIHAMRCRIINAPAFTGNKILGAILFENTMGRQIGGKPSPQYLWENRGVVPFLKVDKGLEDQENGVRLMKAIPSLDSLLDRACAMGVFGTKMRSVIDAANPAGIQAIVAQQFEIGQQILAHDMVPIIEPEVTISIFDKTAAEGILLNELITALNALPNGAQVMLKLTLPEVANHYKPLVDHPRVLSVVALSGGYSRAEANNRLSQNTSMIASFSRALTEGLSAQQDDAAFNATIADTIDSIYRASISG